METDTPNGTHNKRVVPEELDQRKDGEWVYETT